MTENQFKSIYGDKGDEFEIEDVSDETLTIPTDEIRAAREEEILEETENPEATGEGVSEGAEGSERQDVEDHAPASDSVDPDHSIDDEASIPEGEAEPYTDEELEGITFGDAEDIQEPHSMPDSDSEQSDEGEETDEPDDDKVSILSYIGHAILFTIPVIGTVLMLIYIISDNKNPHLRHLAQAWLVTLLVIMVGIVAAVTILGIA